jgi:hypothetical protein
MRSPSRLPAFLLHLPLLLLLCLPACKSKKTPDLVRRWQVAGTELRSPTWRAINRDGDEPHGILRLRPPGAQAGLAGMSLRWDVVDPPSDPARALQGLEQARDLIVGHLVGELRLPGMVHAGKGQPRSVQGHAGQLWEITVDEAKVSASVVAWHCPVTRRSFIFDLQAEGGRELRQAMAERVLETVHCHAKSTAVEPIPPPPIALPEGFAPLKDAPAGWARYRAGETTLHVGPGVAMGERRGQEPEVARRVVPWASFPAVHGLVAGSSKESVVESDGARAHRGVMLKGTAHDPSRAQSPQVPTLALRWDCPYRRKTFTALATAPSEKDLDAAVPFLRQIRCHTDDMTGPVGAPPGDPAGDHKH